MTATTAIATLRAEVEEVYRRRTPGSAALAERAAAVLPGGDTRTSIYFRPYPLFLDAGEGAWVTDVDGNRYLDCLNCYSAMVLGHAHPAVVEAVTRQAARGTAFGAFNAHAAELAELLVERVPSVEKVRFTNSGTEATMLAVRAARALTGRPKIVKMIGAYHGSHDDFEVADGHPEPGIIPGAADHVLEVEYNNKDDVSRVLGEHGHEVAAVIVEGVLGSAGLIPPEDGYLAHLRAETERCGALLVLDEVITLRLSLGGAQELYRVRPDLTAMGKIIGGGFPVGAFGGREEVMQQFSPLAERPLIHSGTFNANPVTMAAGVATLRELDADTVGYVNRLGDRFAEGAAGAAAEAGVPLQVTGVGSLRQLHFAAQPPRTVAQARAADKDLARLLHLKLLAEGMLIAPRGMMALSTVTSEAEIDQAVATLGAALRWLRPAAEVRAGA